MLHTNFVAGKCAHDFIHEMKFMKESGTPTGSFAGKNLLDKPLSNKIYDLSQKL